MAAALWYDEGTVEETVSQIDDYDITASPNDFNLLTLNSFIESGAVKIPGFQRNYVWDRGRASRLIESLIIGIPVPQLFIYEESKNKFLVIDGQQRLMTVYYFFKRRFPRKEKRIELRRIFEANSGVPPEVLGDDAYFEKFNLHLPSDTSESKNKFNGLNYDTLGDFKTQFDLRTLRNIIIRQNSPEDDDSSVYEVFNRLNTGGVNLRPQEIRTSMYHSNFYAMLYRINNRPAWRTVLGLPEPDINMKDIEILLRSFAFLTSGDEYKPSLIRFLNKFSKRAKAHDAGVDDYFEKFFDSYLESLEDVPAKSFVNESNNRFNVVLFESVFYASCRNAFAEKRLPTGRITNQEVNSLAKDDKFRGASIEGTTRSDNVKTRLERALAIVGSL